MKIKDLKAGHMYLVCPTVVFDFDCYIGPKNWRWLKNWAKSKPGDVNPPQIFMYMGSSEEDWLYMAVHKKIHWAYYQGEMCVLDNWMAQWCTPIEGDVSNV